MFRNTLRLEAADLQHQPIERLRVPLKRHHQVVGRIEVKHLDANHLKLSWSANGGTATESQVLTVHWGAVLSLRCPECKEFRRRLYFTTHDDCPFDTNWFHCERCIDRHLEHRDRGRRTDAQHGNERDRRAKRASHSAVASEPVDPYRTSAVDNPNFLRRLSCEFRAKD
jgi:hypothetical protein